MKLKRFFFFSVLNLVILSPVFGGESGDPPQDACTPIAAPGDGGNYDYLNGDGSCKIGLLPGDPILWSSYWFYNEGSCNPSDTVCQTKVNSMGDYQAVAIPDTYTCSVNMTGLPGGEVITTQSESVGVINEAYDQSSFGPVSVVKTVQFAAPVPSQSAGHVENLYAAYPHQEGPFQSGGPIQCQGSSGPPAGAQALKAAGGVPGPASEEVSYLAMDEATANLMDSNTGIQLDFNINAITSMGANIGADLSPHIVCTEESPEPGKEAKQVEFISVAAALVRVGDIVPGSDPVEIVPESYSEASTAILTMANALPVPGEVAGFLEVGGVAAAVPTGNGFWASCNGMKYYVSEFKSWHWPEEGV